MTHQKFITLLTYGNFPYGGASANLLRYFAIGLSRLGNKVEVILPTGNYYGQKVDHNKKSQGTIDGVKYKHLGFINHPRNMLGKIADNALGILLPFVYLLRKKQRKETDLIICYDVALPGILSLLAVKTITRQKLILILPEFYEKPKKKAFSIQSLKWYSFRFSMYYLIKYADGFIVVSHFLREFVDNALRRQKPIMLMPNLVAPERFSNVDVPPFKVNKTTIGYIGTPTRKDGVDDLIESFSLLNGKYPDTHLLIIGDITNGRTLIPRLKEKARNLGVLNSITFTGLVAHDKVPELLHSCQILALTRPRGVFAEAGFPTKLGEYFACQKPVVITDIGDIPLYFKNERHVMLVKAENIESIVGGFERIITNEKIREMIPINAYEWMKTNLNYRLVAKRIDTFLNGVAIFHHGHLSSPDQREPKGKRPESTTRR